MAKMNKYWGMVAIGALTASAAGAVAAVLMKKKPVAEGPDFEDDFDDDAVSVNKSGEDSRDGHEAFASWEPSESEDVPAEEPADGTGDSAEETEENGEAEEDSAEEEEAVEEALKEATAAADAFDEAIAEAEKEDAEESDSIKIN